MIGMYAADNDLELEKRVKGLLRESMAISLNDYQRNTFNVLLSEDAIPQIPISVKD